jgi:hypothetical protein
MAIIKTGAIAAEKNFEFLHSDDELEDFVICKSPEKLKLLIDSLQQGKLIHFVSNGDWSMHDLVVELLKLYAPAELWFTTYALREFAVRQLLTALDKKQLFGVHILIDYKARARTPDVIQLAEMNVNRVYLTSVHAKVCVLKSTKGCVSINCSANWTSNPRIESGTISLNEAVANFHINWINKTMENAEIFK